MNKNPSPDHLSKDRIYPIEGIVSGISHRMSRNQKPYFVAKFAYRLNGGPQQVRTAQGFGKAYDAVRPSLVEGASIRISGRFDSSPEGQTIVVVGLARKRKPAKSAIA